MTISIHYCPIVEVKALTNLSPKHRIAFFLAFALALCPVHIGIYFYLKQSETFQVIGVNPTSLGIIGLSLTPWAYVCQGIVNLVLLQALLLQKNRKVFILQFAMTIIIAIADSIPVVIYYFRYPYVGIYPTFLPVLVAITATLIATLMWDYIFPTDK